MLHERSRLISECALPTLLGHEARSRSSPRCRRESQLVSGKHYSDQAAAFQSTLLRHGRYGRYGEMDKRRYYSGWQELCPTIRMGSSVDIFSNSTEQWFEGLVVDCVEDGMIRVEYEVDGAWFAKYVHVDSDQLLVPADISSHRVQRPAVGSDHPCQERDPGGFVGDIATRFFKKPALAAEIYEIQRVREDPSSKLNAALGKASIANEAFDIFAEHHLYREGREDHRVAAWALKSCTAAVGSDKLLRLILPWLLGCVIRGGPEEPAAWTKLCEEALPSILRHSPLELSAPGQSTGQSWEEKHRSSLAAQKTPTLCPGECSRIAAIGVIAADVQKLWQQLGRPLGKFLHSYLAKPFSGPADIKRWSMSAEQARCLLDKNTYAFVVAHVSLEHWDADLALAILHKTPREVLMSAQKLPKPWDKPSGPSSYFELYMKFNELGFHAQAQRFVATLADTNSFSEIAMKTFVRNTMAEDPNLVLSFYICIVSEFRRCNSRMTEAVPLMLLDCVLERYSPEEKTDGTDGPDETAAALETVLLLSSDDLLLTWAKRSSKGQLREQAKAWMVHVGVPHVSAILKRALASGSTYDAEWADEVIGLRTKKWTWEERRAYFSGDDIMFLERRSQDISQILWMFLKFSLALDDVPCRRKEGKSLMLVSSFLQECRGLGLFEHFIPRRSALRAALALELQSHYARGGGEILLRARELEELVEWEGFFGAAFQELLLPKHRESLLLLRKVFQGRRVGSLLRATVKLLSLEGYSGTAAVSVPTFLTNASWLCNEEARSTKLFLQFVDKVNEMPVEDLLKRKNGESGSEEGETTLRLGEFHSCVQKLGTILGFEGKRSKVDDALRTIQSGHPAHWLGHLDELLTSLRPGSKGASPRSGDDGSASSVPGSARTASSTSPSNAASAASSDVSRSDVEECN